MEKLFVVALAVLGGFCLAQSLILAEILVLLEFDEAFVAFMFTTGVFLASVFVFAAFALTKQK